MLRPGSSPESLCFLSLVCYCVAARYTMCVCVCVGINSLCMKQDLTDTCL